jgi:hypothetical protein
VFLGFLHQIKKSVPGELELHLIVGNYCTREHAKIVFWPFQRSRFHVHHTPSYTS